MQAGALAFADLAPEAPIVSFLDPVALGSKRERTPQGYLVIRDVVIARTGTQIYHGSEVPIEPGPMGFVEVDREADDLFRPEVLASFEGIPVTNDHPKVNGVLSPLNPDNWSGFVVGHIRNVRRGEGEQSNFLLADVVLCSREIIELVELGKRQVSAGYDAVYYRIEAGRGKQAGFVGNHLAVVQSGRCGPVCAFGDEAPDMTTGTNPPVAPGTPAAPAVPSAIPAVVPRVGRRFFADRRAAPSPAASLAARRILAAVATGDEDYIAQEIEAASGPEDDTPATDPMAALQAALDEAKAEIEKLKAAAAAAAEAPAQAAAAAAEVQAVAEELVALAGEDLPDELVTDAAWRDVISRGEVLAPGMTTPTGDSIATPAARRATIVAHQRRALSTAYDAAPAVLGPIFGTSAKPALDKIPGMALRGYFIAASDKAAAANRAKHAASLPAGFTADASGAGAMPNVFGLPQPVPGLTPAASKVANPAAINARAAEVWASRTATK